MVILNFPSNLFSTQILNKDSIQNKMRIGFNLFLKEVEKSKNKVLQKRTNELRLQKEAYLGFDLHLRNAGMSFKDIEIVTNAMQKATADGILNIKSFSLSYNPGISDKGVRMLVKTFPPQLTELGLVECNLGDQAGKAIYHLVQNSNNLQLICIEGNLFSSGLKNKFKALSKQKKNILLII